jgi:hypothetical protein
MKRRTLNAFMQSCVENLSRAPIPEPEPIQEPVVEPERTPPKRAQRTAPPTNPDKLADFTERLYGFSQKRRDRILAESAIVEAFTGGKIGDDGVPLAEVERRWKAQNATEDWRWKNGAKAQTLAQWITDGNYRYEVGQEQVFDDEPFDPYAGMTPEQMAEYDQAELIKHREAMAKLGVRI